MIINQTNNTNVTRVTNNVTNVNNWFQGNTWRNHVTINDRHWNGRPWWYQSSYRDWHHGHWHGRYYFRGRNSWKYISNDDQTWLNGLVAWGLGNLVYRSGYQVYANPYYVRPIVIGSTTINYSRPICVQRSRYEILYQNDEAKAALLQQQAETYFERARTAFYQGNESLAYDNISRALSLMPDDTSMHEFRALILFAAGKYREAAETMHAVLAVAPGWDWTTMSALYYDHDIYVAQLRKLETYVRANSRSAEARFLLAYHYITMGYPEYAEQQLQAVLVLNPDDRLSADLLSLVRKENDDDDNQFSAFTTVQNAETQIQGRWKARRPNGEIELTLNDEGEFVWDYDLSDNDEKFGGKYEMTGQMLLLATAEGSQMVGTVEQDDPNQFTFRLLGSNENDPGVKFTRR